MSAELKARFTADASDFNGAVRQIEGKLKGIGKISQGVGLGRVGAGVGDFLQGIGGLGMGAGGLAGAGIALVGAYKGLTAALDERTKAMEQGMSVPELTGLGQALSDGRKRVEQSFRALSPTAIGVLFTQGFDAYSDYVTGEMQRTAELYNESLKRATQRRDMEADQAREIAANEKRLNDAVAADLADRTRRSKSFFGGIEDYKTDTIVSALEKTGSPQAAEAIRLSNRFNEQLGGDFYTPERVLSEFGEMIAARAGLATMGEQIAAPETRLNEVLQNSPELSDRLRRIGGGGTGYDQTTQVFREALTVERQSLQKLTVIADEIRKPTAATTF